VLIFNFWDLSLIYSKNFISLHKIIEAYSNVDVRTTTVYVNSHYTKIYHSNKYDDKNLTHNLISSPTIKVIYENGDF
jgi:hypothetical protein